jgi:hypothetical protein
VGRPGARCGDGAGLAAGPPGRPRGGDRGPRPPRRRPRARRGRACPNRRPALRRGALPRRCGNGRGRELCRRGGLLGVRAPLVPPLHRVHGAGGRTARDRGQPAHRRGEGESRRSWWSSSGAIRPSVSPSRRR